VLQSKRGEWLIERLGKAITQRRQYLRYCRAHHDKTCQDPEAKPTPNIVRSDEPIPQASARHMPSGRSDFSKPMSTLAPTQASTLLLTSGQAIEDEMIEETQSQTSYATSTDEESNTHKLRVIQLEDVSKGIKHFECPYCWQIQASRTQKAWK
jgi:ligand-binding sensor protein